MRNLGFAAIAACLAVAPLAALAAPQTFAAPQDALDAMIAAVQDRDKAALLQVFGPEAEEVIFTGDARRDRANRTRILAMYREGFRFVPQEDGSLVIDLGAEDWPFAIPLVKTGAGWSFDIEAGREEIANRQIGLNELDVMTLMDAYGDVQARFRLVDHDADGVMEFAQSIIASAEDRNGLYWPGEDSPIGEMVALASLDGYSDDSGDHPPVPYDGYYFRILTSQTDKAKGGAMDYIVNGNMVAGHAVLAVPAEYGVTGIHSFMVGENGVILEADFGEETLDKAGSMTSFDPGEDWTPVP